MPVCEICKAEITEGGAKDVPAVKLFSAARMGYEPYSGSDPGRSCEQQREDFLLLLEMHDPSWTLCPACCGAVESHAAKEGDAGPRAPEVIRIFGNGFQPDPAKWRLMLGAWLEKWGRKGIEVTVAGTTIEIEKCAKAPFEDFIELVPNQKKGHPDQLVDDLITQDIEDGIVLVAVWSVKDSQAMKKILEKRGEMKSSNRTQLPHAPEGELWQPGHLLMGRFQISAVKRGSMGLIYFCKYFGDTVIPFVIKTLPRKLLLDHRELFLQEISTWVDLGGYPYVVHAYGAQEIEERACLFLEYVAGDARHGSDLSGWIGTPELDLKRAVTFAWQVCAGMLHTLEKFERVGKAFVHRDLKPTNLFVESLEQIKISDFGIAVLRDLAQTGLPPMTQGFGNRVYMSPEQCRGDLKLDARSDIYSFGCVLYEMLTATTVFSLPRTSPDYMEAHLNESPRDPGAINPAIPPALGALVMKCLRKEPEARYLDFAALQDELGRIYQQLYSAPLPEASSSRVNGKAAALAGVTTKDFLGKTTEALEQVEALDTTESDKIGQTAAILRTETLAKLGRNKEALEFLDRVVGQRPKDARLWNQRGRLLLNLERREDALASFDRACELDRFDPAILNNKAYVLLELNRPKQALRCFETCLLLNPRLAAAWNNKGRAQAALEEWAEASASYGKSVASNPIEAEVWFNWSVAEANLQRTDSAKAHLRQCLVVDPLHWKALRNLAVLLRETPQTEDDLPAVEDALEAQTAFVRDHPQDLNFLRELVITLLALDRKTEARELVEQQESQRIDQGNKEKEPMSHDQDMAAITIVVLQYTQALMGGKVCRLAIELPADVDKHKVIFLGLLPLILADAVERRRAVMWLAPDGNSEARAKNKAREYMILDPMGFATWAYLEAIPEKNFQSTGLGNFWVIGDLDWSGPPIGYQREHVVNAVRRVLATDSCPAVLIHQQGKIPVVPFPPKFGGPCFIATAACGENTPEVERLRQFRDAVLCSSTLGQLSITLYERVSPMLAEHIRSHGWLRAIVRGAVIKPLSAAASWALSRLSNRIGVTKS